MQQRTIITPRGKEYAFGGSYWAFYLLLTSFVIMLGMKLLQIDPTTGEGYFFLNFAKFTLDFVAVILIFQGFLRRSWQVVCGKTFLLALRTLVVYYGVMFLVEALILTINRGVETGNVNQAAAGFLFLEHPLLMGLCIVIYAPITEECLFRGVLYGPFVRKHPFWGSFLSASLFSAIHLVASIGVLPWFHLLLLFVQYLPAGFCLCYMYRRTGTIWGSIFLHILVNFLSMVTTYAVAFLLR